MNSSCYYTDPDTQIQVATIFNIQCVIGSILKAVVPLMVIVVTGMIIYAGAKMIMAGDNPKEYQAGQQTLTYAIIGLVGLGLAWVILRLIETFTGAPVTILNLTL